MDWNRFIQLHCERTEPGLLNEPFNLFSGLLFPLVAVFLWRQLKRQPHQPYSLKFLIIMVALIGFGSMTYHSVSRMWAAAFADALPIAITSCVFMFMLAKHIMRLKLLGGLVLLSLFVAVNLWYKSYFGRGPDGYISLMPTLLLMFGLSIYMFFTRNPSFLNFSIAAIISAVAVCFRIIDNFDDICTNFPIGTHFLWHSFMALYFYIVIRESIKRHLIYDSSLTN